MGILQYIVALRGVVGCGPPLVHRHIAWGSEQWAVGVSFRIRPHCRGQWAVSTLLNTAALQGQWAVGLLQYTATL